MILKVKNVLTSSCLLLCLFVVSRSAGHAATPVQIENERPGTTAWQLSNPADSLEIEGYASLTSVNRGGQISFFVNTSDPGFTIDIYRMGWYGGDGARLVKGGITGPGVRQPMPEPDPLTGLIECDWAESVTITTSNPEDDTDWLSGVYLAKLTGGISGKQSYIMFVVRDDERGSDYLFQSSVTTFQAYNNWGGKSLYQFNTVGPPARKVSFNRPYAPSENPQAAYGNGAADFLTGMGMQAGWEYNMVRWLERNGYDVTYSTNIDTHGDPTFWKGRKAWLSVGHDEYWSWEMREHVEQARDRGVGLGFFSGNVCYWQIRLETSSVTAQPYRTMVAYKTVEDDPYAIDDDPGNDQRVTTRWREAPVNLPEESFIGVMYESDPVDADVIITDPGHWVLSGTGLKEGDRLPGLLGYEVDRTFGHAPPGTAVIAHSPYRFGDGTRYADMASYTTAAGTTVFATGTIQWSWGLDDFNAPRLRSSRLSQAAEQITRNVLARLVGGTFSAATFHASGNATTHVTLHLDGAASLASRP
ncbi:MAG: N,N-dimethylformamidase beta subunit family domain-containing protein [Nitrospiraceae bacterium]